MQKPIGNLIKNLALELGFSKIGFTDTDLSDQKQYLQEYLKNAHHGEMSWLQESADKRTNPTQLLPDARSIIICSLNYYPDCSPNTHISRYALGRDYHKVLKKKLTELVQKTAEAVGEFNYKIFVDTFPILEKALAIKAGIGWLGKNSLVLNEQGSWFFLGGIITDLDLPPDKPVKNRCGSCTKCLEACPTKALCAPYKLNASRCISYLTIEHKDGIPSELETLIGTRVYGCDTCQLACPWNQDSQKTTETDFIPRNNLDTDNLDELLSWTRDEFLENTAGTPIRRIGYERWRRNLAIAIKNKSPR